MIGKIVRAATGSVVVIAITGAGAGWDGGSGLGGGGGGGVITGFSICFGGGFGAPTGA